MVYTKSYNLITLCYNIMYYNIARPARHVLPAAPENTLGTLAVGRKRPTPTQADLRQQRQELSACLGQGLGSLGFRVREIQPAIDKIGINGPIALVSEGL